jgi:hypothetical protein
MNTKARAALAATAGAAIIAAGSGAVALAKPDAAPASSPAPAATGFTWHALHLVNGWKANSPPALGTPAYAVQNGILYLRGGLIANQPRPVADEFAVLPSGFRPGHVLLISCANGGLAWTGTATGTLEVAPNGVMRITILNNNALPSLSGISFPLSS